ncbi:hypothetical protein VNO77_34656 [Canavalia gladiata]|uniref:Uncharacterized protein n=1 Tax=Canavalia gladiata TaxID=3824 RepID=A0AAN9KDX7_CANGL
MEHQWLILEYLLPLLSPFRISSPLSFDESTFLQWLQQVEGVNPGHCDVVNPLTPVKPSSHRGYKCLNIDGHISISKDVIFEKSCFPYTEIFTKATTAVTRNPLRVSLIIHSSTVPHVTQAALDQSLTLLPWPTWRGNKEPAWPCEAARHGGSCGGEQSFNARWVVSVASATKTWSKTSENPFFRIRPVKDRNNLMLYMHALTISLGSY